MRKKISVLFFTSVLFFSCAEEEQKKLIGENNTQQPPSDLPAPAPQIPIVKGISQNTLVGRWKVDGVIMPKGDTVRKDTHYEFREDGTFTQDKNKMLTNGNWKIINDGANLVLSTADRKEETFTEILITGNTGSLVKDNKKFLLSRE